MEILNTGFFIDDELLNFTLEGENEEPISKQGAFQSSSPSLKTPNAVAAAAAATPAGFSCGNIGGPFPEFVEEELEWLSNKDAFPSVETCFGILSDNPELILNHHSPVSVLENSISSNSNSGNSNSSSSPPASCCNSLKVPVNYPVRARSKRRRRRSGFGQSFLSQVICKSKKDLSFSLPPSPVVSNGGASLGRRCLHCQADKTPQWRAGPLGPKTLCNACGVRYKSGRLLPEYRPANSPTFSNVLHSNSHRKVVEMRKQKQGDGGGGGIEVNVACGYNNRVG